VEKISGDISIDVAARSRMAALIVVLQFPMTTSVLTSKMK
jgi:hypothetical protein